jgi:tRNA-Thr(GGU) m(6)t(6)A37 methyltransferase TsaA
MVPYVFEPIGTVRSPFQERSAAPRQAALAADAVGRIELEAGRGFEHALEGLEGFEWLWILFVFHLNVEDARGWKPKVLPPRSATKRGVFATRSPHRPNPIGMTSARLDGIDGLVVRVRGLDLLDGTPVLDLKPYVAYADAHVGAAAGWLETPDPLASWTVAFDGHAAEQLRWLGGRGVNLEPDLVAALALGPQPNPYRRIRRRSPNDASTMTLALKEWRADFVTSEETRTLTVVALRSGYRPRQLQADESLALHRAFVATFPVVA